MGEEVHDGGVAGLLRMDSDGALHHGVLAHEDDGIATKALANALKLGGADIIGADDEDLGVLLEEAAEFLVVLRLLLSAGGLENHGGRETLEIERKDLERVLQIAGRRNPNGR